MTTVKADVFAADGLIQLHWQNPEDLGKTQMVAQGGPFGSPDEMQGWIRQTVESHREKCPEGWRPVICDSTSMHFWMSADSATEQNETAR